MVKYQIFRYFLVGSLAFGVDFSILYFITNVIKVHYLLGALAGFCAGLIVNYIISIMWVFKHRSCQCQETEFVVFVLVGIIGLAFNEFFMWFFTYLAGLYPLISKCLTTIIVFFWNYYSRRALLFQDINKPVSISQEKG